MTNLEKIRVYLLRSEPDNNLLHCVTKDILRNEIIVKYETTAINSDVVVSMEVFREGHN